MQYKIVVPDSAGRWKVGDVGEALPNDFNKYHVKLDLGEIPKAERTFLDGERKILYFYKHEVEEVKPES